MEVDKGFTVWDPGFNCYLHFLFCSLNAAQMSKGSIAGPIVSKFNATEVKPLLILPKHSGTSKATDDE